MVKKILSVLIAILIVLQSKVFAGCPPMPEIGPIVHDGVEYQLEQSPIELFGEPVDFSGWYTQVKLKAIDLSTEKELWEKITMHKIVPLRFFKVTSTFPNFPGEILESTLRANNANYIFWVK